MSLEEIIAQIRNCSITDGDELDPLIDDIAVETEELQLTREQKEQLIHELLRYIERQPDPEFTSWSLVHFIEWLDQDYTTNYSQQLLHSVQRKPHFFTLLLLNRMLNDLPDDSGIRTVLMDTLKKVTESQLIDEAVRAEAAEFFQYQMEKKRRRIDIEALFYFREKIKPFNLIQQCVHSRILFGSTVNLIS